MNHRQVICKTNKRVAELCVKYKSFVGGIDIAGSENGHVYETEDELLQVKAMQYCIEHGIKRTVHAGERKVCGSQSVRNALRLFKVMVFFFYHAIFRISMK